MPVAKGTVSSGLARNLKTHARDETDYGQDFSNLPADISGGIARLVDAKLGVYKSGPNAGKQFLFLSGCIEEPTETPDVKKVFENGKVKILSSKVARIKGLHTRQTLALCETKTGKAPDVKVRTEEDNQSRAMNELRKLGGDDFLATLEELPDDATNEQAEAELKSLLADLVNAAPYFRFTTSGKDPSAAMPKPSVFENWFGTKGLEEYVSEGTSTGTSQVVTGTGTESPNGTPASAAAPSNEVSTGEADYDELATRADGADDTDAQKAITAKATELGMDISKVGTWAEAADMIKTALAGGGDGAATGGDDGAEVTPAKGEVWRTKLKDPKTNRKRFYEVEVLSVNEAERTVTLKNNETKKPVHGDDKKPLHVSFDDIELLPE